MFRLFSLGLFVILNLLIVGSWANECPSFSYGFQLSSLNYVPPGCSRNVCQGLLKGSYSGTASGGTCTCSESGVRMNIGDRTPASSLKLCSDTSAATGESRNNSSPNGSSCQSQKYQEALDALGACQDVHQTAASDCNSESNPSLMGVNGAASNLSNMVGTVTSTSMAAACSSMGKVAQGATVALATFKAMCSGAIASCQESCSRANVIIEHALANTPQTCRAEIQELTSMKADLNSIAGDCQGKEQSIAQADASVQQLAATYMQSRQCASQSASVASSICDTYPQLKACKTATNIDCTIASNQNLKECICQRNPKDPKCANGLAGINKTITGVGGNSSFGSKNADDFAAGSDAFKMNGSPIGPDGVGVPGDSAGGSKARSNGIGSSGGMGALGGSGGGSSYDGGRAMGGDGDGPDASIKGGRSTGGGYSIPGSSSSDEGSGGAYGVAGGAGGRDGSGIDLKKYLPGGIYDPKRKLAGAVGPDGITCPTCGTLFEKVTIRYNAVKSQLKDE